MPAYRLPILALAATVSLLVPADPAAGGREPVPQAASMGLAPTVASAHPVSSSAAFGAPLLSLLVSQAPRIDAKVLSLALEARRCAVQSGQAKPEAHLALIDYSRPSTEPRMWVFDLERARLLYAEHVAHGRNTGENMATAFSNLEGSFQSSLGLFATAEAYVGDNGYSMRMDGLEPGVNDAARQRAIVIHGAPYVNPEQALRQGRLGRSLGCPALRPQVAREVIDTIKDGHLVFAYYPDKEWLASSRFLGCPDRTLATKASLRR